MICNLQFNQLFMLHKSKMPWKCLLFLNLMETFSNAQIAFLHALIASEKQLSSKRVLQKYTIGTSGNVVRIRQNLIEREILDTKEDALVFQDPLFEGWLRKCYFKCGE